MTDHLQRHTDRLVAIQVKVMRLDAEARLARAGLDEAILARREARLRRGTAVFQARMGNLTWEQIGDALEMTPQGATAILQRLAEEDFDSE